jgi:uncharacterized protein YecT (DUF1311 family)
MAWASARAPGAARADAAAALSACLAGAADGAACIGVWQDGCQAADPSTAGIVACLDAEAAAWDAALNAAWGPARDAAKATDARRAAEGQGGLPKAWEALLAAQRAWLAFRDAECASLYADWAEGTIRGPVAADCRMRLTAERALALRARIEP